MSTSALTKTRVVLSALMATATVATTGIVTSLALARSEQDADAAVVTDQAAGTAGATADTPRTHTASPTFAPTPKAKSTSGTTHTKTKGS